MLCPPPNSCNSALVLFFSPVLAKLHQVNEIIQMSSHSSAQSLPGTTSLSHSSRPRIIWEETFTEDICEMAAARSAITGHL